MHDESNYSMIKFENITCVLLKCDAIILASQQF